MENGSPSLPYISTSVSAINVYSNGGTINDNGLPLTISDGFFGAGGNGVNGITSFTPGAGYLAHPSW